MYASAQIPLIVATGIALGAVTFLVVRRPVLRRLALRQIARRPTEAALVVIGSLLGTTLIVASMAVGDSLDRSMRQTAYDVLGPIDETVRSSSLSVGDAAASRLHRLADDQRIDGLLTVRGDQAAAVSDGNGVRLTEPRALVWELDFDEAASFGSPDPSGLAVDDPGPGRVVVNENLAEVLDASTGDVVTFQLYGRAERYTVADVVPAEGLAGMGLGAAVNRNAFFSPGTLASAARSVGRDPTTTTLVSNRGGVEEGEQLTKEVTAALRQHLGRLADSGAVVGTPKQEVLEGRAGDRRAAWFAVPLHRQFQHHRRCPALGKHLCHACRRASGTARHAARDRNAPAACHSGVRDRRQYLWHGCGHTSGRCWGWRSAGWS